MHPTHRFRPLLPRAEFVKRFARSASIALGLIVSSLALGAFGYHVCEDLPWLESTLNAVMILTGMGPVDPLRTTAGKYFGIFYALFSGVAFLTMVAVLFAPVAHRFLHRFHLDIAHDPGDERP